MARQNVEQLMFAVVSGLVSQKNSKPANRLIFDKNINVL